MTTLNNSNAAIISSYRNSPEAFLRRFEIDVKSRNQDQLSCICPFHNDKNPSLSVDGTQGLWICFAGCGKGNLFHLIGRILNICPHLEFKKLKTKIVERLSGL